jgi:excisionase family DNA binding protein
MSRRGVSGVALARSIGVSQGYIAKRLRNEALFTFNDIESIAPALQVPVAELLPTMGATKAKTRIGAGERPDTGDVNSGVDPAAVVSMAGPCSAPDPYVALDEGTRPMTVRIDELFENLPLVLSVNDLTRILGKDRATVYRWLKKGEIPGVLIDTTWIIYRDEVRDYLLSRHNQIGAAPDGNSSDEGREPEDESSSA